MDKQDSQTHAGKATGTLSKIGKLTDPQLRILHNAMQAVGKVSGDGKVRCRDGIEQNVAFRLHKAGLLNVDHTVDRGYADGSWSYRVTDLGAKVYRAHESREAHDVQSGTTSAPVAVQSAPVSLSSADADLLASVACTSCGLVHPFLPCAPTFSPSLIGRTGTTVHGEHGTVVGAALSPARCTFLPDGPPCTCPSDCGCKRDWRTTYCGCRAHAVETFTPHVSTIVWDEQDPAPMAAPADDDDDRTIGVHDLSMWSRDRWCEDRGTSEYELRQTASEWHDGQSSALYAYNSSGTITAWAVGEAEDIMRWAPTSSPESGEDRETIIQAAQDLCDFLTRFDPSQVYAQADDLGLDYTPGFDDEALRERVADGPCDGAGTVIGSIPGRADESGYYPCAGCVACKGEDI